MAPNFVPNRAINWVSQLGPMSIAKLSPNWACQMGPIHLIKFLLSGWSSEVSTSGLGPVPDAVFPFEKRTYTYILNQNLGRTSLLMAITPNNVDVLDIFCCICALMETLVSRGRMAVKVGVV